MKETEREKDFFWFVPASQMCSDPVASTFLSHVVVRDVSVSLSGLLRCHISPSLKYAPAKAPSDAKIKKR